MELPGPRPCLFRSNGDEVREVPGYSESLLTIRRAVCGLFHGAAPGVVPANAPPTKWLPRNRRKNRVFNTRPQAQTSATGHIHQARTTPRRKKHCRHAGSYTPPLGRAPGVHLARPSERTITHQPGSCTRTTRPDNNTDADADRQSRAYTRGSLSAAVGMGHPQKPSHEQQTSVAPGLCSATWRHVLKGQSGQSCGH